MRIFAATPWALRQAFGVFGTAGHVISLLGGGGKTTLLNFMASTCARQGKKVLISTVGPGIQTEQEAKRAWARGDWAAINMENGVLLTALMQQTDVTILEADWAAGMPCKVPCNAAPHPECDLVIAVFGLSGVGRPLGEVCFRPEEAMALLGTEDKAHILTPADAAALLAARKDQSGRKYCVVLNQCDDGKRRTAGNRITAELALRGVPRVVMTAFDEAERAQ